MKRSILFTVWGILFGLAGMPAAHAATYYVATTGNNNNPGTQAAPFLTIKKGMDTAQNGDTVLVAAGTYMGTGNRNLDFNGKKITVKSQNGAANCIIDCQQSGRGFQFLSGETAQSVLEGVTIRNGKVTETFGGAAGGAIALQNSSPTIRNCVLINNTAIHSNGGALGGGIVVQNGSPALENCTFSSNTVLSTSIAGGGGLAIISNSNPTIINCTFTGNAVNSSNNSGVLGGGIYSTESTANVISCTFSDNSANYGGGMAAEGSNTTLIDSTFTNNSGQAYGGGLYNIASNASLSQCTFSGNSTRFAGGGVSNLASNSIITHCTFTANASTEGVSGGLENNMSDATLTQCTFIGNAADLAGGGMSNINSNPTIRECTFMRNSCKDEGGGIYNFQSNPAITNCAFLGNAATGRTRIIFGVLIRTDGYGGGMYNETSNPSVTNCLFIGNRSDNGAGMSCYTSQSVVTNCTFMANSGYYAAGIFNASDGNLTARNCILRSTTTGSLWSTMVGVEAKYSNIEWGNDQPDANFNFSVDPLFVRDPSPGPDYLWATADDDYGDLHLQAGSRSIDAGTATAPGLPLYDKDTKNRIAGSAPDQGAYEFGSTFYIAANFYVDKATGSDTTGNGTPAAPFQTVTKALSLADPIGFIAIHIKTGNYGSDRPRVAQRVRFVNWGNTGQARIGKN
jgi:hypothetical protein